MSNGNGSTGVELSLFGFNSKIVPDIDFCVKDASVVESDVISNYENYYFLITRVVKTLARGDPVRLFLLTIIYQLVVQRSIVDSTGKENLLKYSHGANLDNLGAKWGEYGLRTKATKAETMIMFTLSSPITTNCPVPEKTLVQATTGEPKIFITTEEGIIHAGQLTCEVHAEATQAGAAHNGFVPGQINQLVSWNSPFLVSATNTRTSSGGADVEADDHFRARIWMAPETLTTTGPKEQYEAFAAKANPDIMDVSVWSAPEVAGQVYIYPLMNGGRLPTVVECQQVYASCNADKVRPLTDEVFVQPPIVRLVLATVKFWIRKEDGRFEDDIVNKVMQAWEDWKIWQVSKIGRDLNPSKLDQMMVDAGAKHTDISSPQFTVLDEKTVAQIDPNSVCNYEGLEEE
jgi:phage-related baseplate assembly protein